MLYGPRNIGTKVQAVNGLPRTLTSAFAGWRGSIRWPASANHNHNTVRVHNSYADLQIVIQILSGVHSVLNLIYKSHSNRIWYGVLLFWCHTQFFTIQYLWWYSCTRHWLPLFPCQHIVALRFASNQLFRPLYWLLADEFCIQPYTKDDFGPPIPLSLR